jgi:hypothetical protein
VFVCSQVERGSIWTFEQEQALGFSNVTTNVRMTVIKLRSGGLWVHAPIAPTKWVHPSVDRQIFAHLCILLSLLLERICVQLKSTASGCKPLFQLGPSLMFNSAHSQLYVGHWSAFTAFS